MTITPPLPWKPSAQGDILVTGMASWFGGNDDPDDDGSTASGLSTKGNPGLMGCALPMAHSNGVIVPGCAGSPIPSMPYLTTLVIVTGPKGSVKVPLIDVGPDLYENRPIDLTQATFQTIGGDLKVGLVQVTFRIIGAAKYLLP